MLTEKVDEPLNMASAVNCDACLALSRISLGQLKLNSLEIYNTRILY